MFPDCIGLLRARISLAGGSPLWLYLLYSLPFFPGPLEIGLVGRGYDRQGRRLHELNEAGIIGPL